MSENIRKGQLDPRKTKLKTKKNVGEERANEQKFSQNIKNATQENAAKSRGIEEKSPATLGCEQHLPLSANSKVRFSGSCDHENCSKLLSRKRKSCQHFPGAKLPLNGLTETYPLTNGVTVVAPKSSRCPCKVHIRPCKKRMENLNGFHQHKRLQPAPVTDKEVAAGDSPERTNRYHVFSHQQIQRLDAIMQSYLTISPRPTTYGGHHVVESNRPLCCIPPSPSDQNQITSAQYVMENIQAHTCQSQCHHHPHSFNLAFPNWSSNSYGYPECVPCMPVIYIELRNLVRTIRDRLVEEQIPVREIRLNGGAAACVVATSQEDNFSDVDLLFSVDLSNVTTFNKIKSIVLSSIAQFLADTLASSKVTYSCEHPTRYWAITNGRRFNSESYSTGGPHKLDRSDCNAILHCPRKSGAIEKPNTTADDQIDGTKSNVPVTAEVAGEVKQEAGGNCAPQVGLTRVHQEQFIFTQRHVPFTYCSDYRGFHSGHYSTVEENHSGHCMFPDTINRGFCHHCISWWDVLHDESLMKLYIQKMVRIHKPSSKLADSWSLFSLGYRSAEGGCRTVDLKFVDRMQRKFEFTVDSFQISLDSLLTFYDTSRQPMSKHYYPTVVAESVSGSFSQALLHLQQRMIVTQRPEEIRGGGLLKYCKLLVDGYRPSPSTNVLSMERYMCSRFFIDFPDIHNQHQRIVYFLDNHFDNSTTLKATYLQILHEVVSHSTICLMTHERQQTLCLIRMLLQEVLSQLEVKQTAVHLEEFSNNAWVLDSVYYGTRYFPRQLYTSSETCHSSPSPQLNETQDESASCVKAANQECNGQCIEVTDSLSTDEITELTLNAGQPLDSRDKATRDANSECHGPVSPNASNRVAARLSSTSSSPTDIQELGEDTLRAVSAIQLNDDAEGRAEDGDIPVVVVKATPEGLELSIRKTAADRHPTTKRATGENPVNGKALYLPSGTASATYVTVSGLTKSNENCRMAYAAYPRSDTRELSSRLPNCTSLGIEHSSLQTSRGTPNSNPSLNGSDQSMNSHCQTGVLWQSPPGHDLTLFADGRNGSRSCLLAPPSSSSSSSSSAITKTYFGQEYPTQHLTEPAGELGIQQVFEPGRCCVMTPQSVYYYCHYPTIDENGIYCYLCPADNNNNNYNNKYHHQQQHLHQKHETSDYVEESAPAVLLAYPT